MPKNQVSDLITDQEIAFVHLILAGTMTDRRAAEAVGLNPDTAAYIKAKPRVRAYMLQHRAAVREKLVQQEAEELRRQNLGREQVLARLWEIANLSCESTRGSITGQVKALSMIVAIEGLIPDRRSISAQNKSAPSPVYPQIDTTTGPSWRAGEPAVELPDPPPGPVADAPSDQDPAVGLTFNPSEPTYAAHPVGLAEMTSSLPNARAFASDNRAPSSIEKKPCTWRLRL